MYDMYMVDSWSNLRFDHIQRLHQKYHLGTYLNHRTWKMAFNRSLHSTAQLFHIFFIHVIS